MYTSAIPPCGFQARSFARAQGKTTQMRLDAPTFARTELDRGLGLAMPRRSIFISHASADKQALEPLVRTFIQCGYKVFVDNPIHDSWRFHAADIEAWAREDRFEQIRNAKDWLGELRTALSRCDVVLVCLSNQLSEIGPELMAELIIADREGKLIACALPGADYEQVKAQAGFFSVGAGRAILVDPAAIWRAVQRLPEPASIRDRSATDPDLHSFQHLLLEIAKEPKDRLDADMQAGGYVSRSPMGNVYDSALARAIHRARRGQQRQRFRARPSNWARKCA